VSGFPNVLKTGILIEQHPVVVGSAAPRSHQNSGKENAMANPFVYIELNSQDVEKAKSFYGELFDWGLKDISMGTGGGYTMINVGEGTGGGILRNPMPGVPSAWVAYVQVDDVMAVTNKAKSLGATVIKDIAELKGYGSFSIIADPSGAILGLWESR